MICQIADVSISTDTVHTIITHCYDVDIAHMSAVESLVMPIQRACCFPSAIIACMDTVVGEVVIVSNIIKH